MTPRLRVAVLMLVSTAVLAGLGSLLLWLPQALAAAPGSGGPALAPEVLQSGYLAAALATGLSSLGAAYAVANVGAAAVGALTEKPELFGRLIILIGLSEGIAIYGLIISVLILNDLA